MSPLRTLATLVLISALFGCGGADDTNPGPQPDPNALTFDTGNFDIPAGDSLTCFYTDVITDRELDVVDAAGYQQAGGHHVIIYYADTKVPVQHHACTDAEMVSWHQITGANGKGDQGAEGLLKLPPGIALKVPQGKQIVLQSHYINTTGKGATVHDAITIKTTTPDKVVAYANYFAMVDTSFEVPPQAPLVESSTCTVAQDLDAIILLGHMHEYGKHFKLEHLDDQGAVLETMYEHDWAPEYASHPPTDRYTVDQPLKLTKGMRLRQTCDWQNTTATPLVFPREMCVTFFYYFPDQGELTCDLEFP